MRDAPTLDTAPFRDAAAQGVLLLRRCTACDRVHFYPRLLCPFCHSDSGRWVEANGAGVIYSFTSMGRGEATSVPVLVTLAEGVTLAGALAPEPAPAPRIGDAVRVAASVDDAGRPTVVFVIAGDAATA